MMIKNCVAFSTSDDQFEAFNEVREQINEYGKPVLIIFSAPVEGFFHYTGSFKKYYPECTTIGTTSYITYCSKGYGEGKLAALAVFDGIEISSGIICEISRYPMKYSGNIEEALETIETYENTVCIEFSTGGGKSEELVQDTYRAVLEHKNIPVIGGTAGALTMTSKTYVSLNGIVYSDSSVFVLIKNLNGRILTYKENMFKPTGRYIVATDVDCDERIVYEFEGKPAATVMAEILKENIEDLRSDISLHPLGRMAGDDIYITDADRVYQDGSIGYFARIYNHTKLAILEADDLDKVWEETAINIKYDIPNPSMTLTVNCYGRAAYFNRIGRTKDFCNKLVTEYGNFIGSSGFGEQINYEHFNETMVMAVFE